MTEKTVERVHRVAEVANENREKAKAIAKEIAYSSIAVVTGGLVGGVIGATIQKAGGYSKTANTIGYVAGLASTYATGYTVYEKLKLSDEIQKKQLAFFDETLATYKEEDLLYEEEDLEEGGETEEA